MSKFPPVPDGHMASTYDRDRPLSEGHTWQYLATVPRMLHVFYRIEGHDNMGVNLDSADGKRLAEIAADMVVLISQVHAQEGEEFPDEAESTLTNFGGYDIVLRYEVITLADANKGKVN